MLHSNEQINSKLDAILSLLNEQKSKPLSLDEAAVYLGISKSFLYRLTSTGAIPYYKPAGKKIYFSKSDLDGYILRNRRKGANEIEAEAVEIVVNGNAKGGIHA